MQIINIVVILILINVPIKNKLFWFMWIYLGLRITRTSPNRLVEDPLFGGWFYVYLNQKWYFKILITYADDNLS